jgi:hypothetical protein
MKQFRYKLKLYFSSPYFPLCPLCISSLLSFPPFLIFLSFFLSFLCFSFVSFVAFPVIICGYEKYAVVLLPFTYHLIFSNVCYHITTNYNTISSCRLTLILLYQYVSISTASSSGVRAYDTI